jgi:hypothetical protein
LFISYIFLVFMAVWLLRFFLNDIQFVFMLNWEFQIIKKSSNFILEFDIVNHRTFCIILLIINFFLFNTMSMSLLLQKYFFLNRIFCFLMPFFNNFFTGKEIIKIYCELFLFFLFFYLLFLFTRFLDSYQHYLIVPCRK